MVFFALLLFGRGSLGSDPLPKFADVWFERYERGDDVAHWYGSAQTAAS